MLDHDYKRATPVEWGEYGIAKEVIRIYNACVPSSLFMSLKANSYMLHRPDRIRFFDNSRLRIGQQSIQNRAASIFGKIDFAWCHNELSADKLRTELKTALFKFPSLKSAAFSFSFSRHAPTAKNLPTETVWNKRPSEVTVSTI